MCWFKTTLSFNYHRNNTLKRKDMQSELRPNATSSFIYFIMLRRAFPRFFPSNFEGIVNVFWLSDLSSLYANSCASIQCRIFTRSTKFAVFPNPTAQNSSPASIHAPSPYSLFYLRNRNCFLIMLSNKIKKRLFAKQYCNSNEKTEPLQLVHFFSNLAQSPNVRIYMQQPCCDGKAAGTAF